MNTDDFSVFSSHCFRDLPPPCTSVCPLRVDVREVIAKMQRGNFAAAYRAYRNHVVFPGIVSEICGEPCREVCVRRAHDESIYMRKLEAACVALTRDKAPIQYNVPKKPFTVAVIGAGLSGLSCALKLASRNYDVTVYEADAQPGGRLLGMLPPEIVHNELTLQFSSVEYALRLSTRVTSLEDISADAVFIATGGGGTDFTLLPSVDANGLGTSRKGVFLGGGLLGANPIQAIAHGVRASHSIEKFLKVGAMDGMPETFTQPAINKNFYRLPVTRMPATIRDADAPSKEEALAESTRCLRCNCSECRDNCELMQHFLAYPMKITADINSSLNVIERLTERVAQRLVNSCTQCGLCGTVCPERVDMEHCILEARRALHNNGSLPKAFHDFWLRDMEHAEGDARLLHLPQGEGKYSDLFFPGCQLGASDPEYVLKTYAWLCKRRPDTALLLGCCGVPADWAGTEPRRDGVLAALRRDWERTGKPRLILACPTCKKTLGRYFPGSEQISLYELLEQDIPGHAPASCHAAVSIYDPCSSREEPAMRHSVRSLVARSGIAVEELDSSGVNSRCCSFGGHMYAANPELAKEIVSRRVGSGINEFVTYCTNCRDIFSLAGKPSRHILDILFTGNPAERRPPSLSQRRRNRMLLKRQLSGNIPEGEGEAAMKLVIPPELASKMDRLLILEEEVQETIRHCEETRLKLLDPETGIYTGHLQIGIITYWVAYTAEADSFVLRNVYAHRMSIIE